MTALPTGTVTFLFTDIEGSTRLLQQLGNRYADVLADYRRLLHAAIQERGGLEVDNQGDAFFFAFSRAGDAVAVAVTAQRAISAHPWPDGASVRVRMGLHTGEALATETRYVGIDVHRAARIGATGHGGQVLLSDTTRALVAKDLPEIVSLRDLGEHRLKDLAHPHHLFQVVVADLPTDFPPLKSLDTLPNNLPRQLTSFIGRERETVEIKRLLATTYLLILTGAGGSGKTSLALQVAADLLDTFPDGVWLVELAPLSDPALVPQLVASALGVPGQPGRSLTETLVDAMRPRSLLLVLDNCEHLLPACAHLTDTLLRACPNLHILATSQEPLGIAGELTYRVPSLSLPDALHLPSVEHLTQYEAVRLFMERAVFSQPGLVLTSQNASAVAQICHRLDGIPLAIELAAARVRGLSVAQIAARLDDRFRLLSGGNRTALPRHQTLRATMDWSYSLLAEPQRMVLRRLSVFAGGFALEAAEGVCSEDGIDSSEVLEPLLHLVDKSLVVAEDRGLETRYRLPETVRQYAWDRLVEALEADRVRRRHRDWYLRVAEQADPKLRGPEQTVWQERLDTEYDNLRAALRWSITEASDVEAACRLAGALHWFWELRSYLGEGRKWLEEVLTNSDRASAAARAKVLSAAGALAWSLGDNAAARSRLHAALAIFQELGDRRGASAALRSLGLAQDDAAAARAFLEQSVSANREIGDNWGLALSTSALGGVINRLGDHAAARALHTESLALFREIGDKWGIARPLRGLGLVAYRQGDLATARSLLEEVLVIRKEMRDKRSIALVLRDVGEVAFCQGDYGRATVAYAEGVTLFWELGNKKEFTACLEGLGQAATANEQWQRAARLFGAAESLREVFGLSRSSADQSENLAVTCAALTETTFAAAWAEGRAMTLEQAIEYALAVDVN